MNIKFRQLLKAVIPSFVKRQILLQKTRKQLNSVTRVDCSTGSLLPEKNLSLDMETVFKSEKLEKMWLDFENKIRDDSMLNGVTVKSVNAGDQRAIYYLTCALAPRSVLEIGTHMGVSTLAIAAALHQCRQGDIENVNLTSVDIMDVNSNAEKPWETYGMPCSPAEMIEQAGYQDFVQFITGSSLNYAGQCKGAFDFIFLDGSHAATTVYQEIPVMLNALSKNGVILLHDYFPAGKPLCPDGKIIPGPVVAIEKLRQEGLDLTVCPAGSLPWLTKEGSNNSSLALLLKKTFA